MTKPIRLFVSSSPELYVEREIVGQVIASLPLTVGWRIGHTPTPGLRAKDMVLSVEFCDLYVLILGHDFSAPMGAELRQAVADAKLPLAFRKKCALSPSAQDAIRRLDATWRMFSTTEGLRTAFTRDLTQALLDRAVPLGLELADVEHLIGLSRKDEGETAGDKEPGASRSDAGRGGVILGREIWETEPLGP